MRHRDEAIGSGIGRIGQEHGVDNAEDRGVGADADRQRRHSHRGKDRALHELTQTIPPILDGVLEPCQASLVAHRLHRLRHTADANPRGATDICRRPALRRSSSAASSRCTRSSSSRSRSRRRLPNVARDDRATHASASTFSVERGLEPPRGSDAQAKSLRSTIIQFGARRPDPAATLATQGAGTRWPPGRESTE